MRKNFHEVRDPIHVFVRLDNDEREVLDSPHFQRLRHIHQLALTYLVYPGATHKRFEHSLEVMELASRVYDIVSHPDNVTDKIKDELPEVNNDEKRRYWRRIIPMAALCHDIGHLPFSHAAEKDLLPKGWDHEQLTKEIILSDTMKEIWSKMTPPLRPEYIVKLAIGPKKAQDLDFSTWETILSEIIVGDAFGVDRMDYLLRDSHHIGVAYGKFDHYRLIDTLRILPSAPSGKNEENSEPALGVEFGGFQSAEALILARYFMYSQVYFHPVRRIYDIHLKDFLKKWLPDNFFSTDLNEHLKITDNEVTAGIYKASINSNDELYNKARLLAFRKHFKLLYQATPTDKDINLEAGQAIYESAKDKFGDDFVKHDYSHQKSGAPEFPVKMPDEQIVSSLAIPSTLSNMPVVSIDYVFADREILPKAMKWLKVKKDEIIQMKIEEKKDG
ncbi:MAG: HD domain-containing protein [Nitrospirae bacterium]|nr:HD domain-containing protein [Nitrospirota bacterium]MBF0533478.1 HD domain-containing protein [Nitrospirota bacterium]MBF0615998.1 HD domain-containing protein [Nitrospirota bacterium]